MNPRPITTNEWWTILIGVIIIAIIILLMMYTGSVEPATTAAGSNSLNAAPNTSNATAALSTESASTSPTSQASGLEVAQAGDTVTLNYTGKLADGTVFDSSASHGQPFSFVLGAGQVIPGWDKGILGMKVGESKVLVIPPSEAYGAQGVKNPSTGKYIIPPNATLTFDVQLISVQPPSASK